MVYGYRNTLSIIRPISSLARFNCGSKRLIDKWSRRTRFSGTVPGCTVIVEAEKAGSSYGFVSEDFWTSAYCWTLQDMTQFWLECKRPLFRNGLMSEGYSDVLEEVVDRVIRVVSPKGVHRPDLNSNVAIRFDEIEEGSWPRTTEPASHFQPVHVMSKGRPEWMTP
jgi:hypothetical protein